MISEEVKNNLKDLGLTEYETRAYVSLVKSGTSTARDLSKISDVPQSRIYDILSKLENRGWIESQSGRPARYRAKSPSEALHLLKIKQEEKFRNASETILEELESLYEKGGEVEKPEVWTLRGRREILGKIEKMFADAKIEVLISIPLLSGIFSRIEDFTSILDMKSLDVRLLSNEKNEITKRLESNQNVEVRFREPLFGGGVIVDGREALIVLESEGRTFGIWSDEVGLAKFAEEYFEYLWTDSKGIY